MELDKIHILKILRFGGVILLLFFTIWRFYSGYSTQINDLLPSSFIKIWLQLKNKINFGLSRVILEPQLSLMKSLFFGSKDNLPFEWKNKIRKVGLSHLVAVSGLHLNIVTQFVSLILDICLITGVFNFLLSALFILGFMVMADFSASVVRAAIMTLLLLLARLNHRLYRSSSAIILAILIMVFLDPKIIFNDLGFQLSVLATLGIIYFSPLISHWSFWQKEIFQNQFHLLKDTLILSFSALIMVTPWVVYQTHFLSLVTPLTNLLVVPLVPIIIIFGLFIGLISLLFYPLGLFLGVFLNFLLQYVLEIINWFSHWAWAEILLPSLPLWLIICIYLGLIIVILKNHETSF
ncbi:MAG: ComEC/Rec2 family competence protein [Minisyncoccia bacterium]